MNQSRELSGALPQPDNSRQNSLGSGFQATGSSGRTQVAMSSGHLAHVASNSSGRVAPLSMSRPVTYTTQTRRARGLQAAVLTEDLSAWAWAAWESACLKVKSSEI